MSIALPFEVLTPTGWQVPTHLKEKDIVACFFEHSVQYKPIRQLLIYPSNFMFTSYTDGDFSVSVCEGMEAIQSVEVAHIPTNQSLFLSHCQEKESEEYQPDPIMECFGSQDKIDSLQIQALTEGIPTIVEHFDTQKRISTVNSASWYPVCSRAACTDTVAVSCFEHKKTTLIARLASFSNNVYKTKCVFI